MFQPEIVERDGQGFWLHSILREKLGVDGSVEALPEAKDTEFRYVAMEVDAPDELADRFLNAAFDSKHGEVDATVREWEPTRPKGDCWVLIGIYDTEDGPYACFARPKLERPNRHRSKLVEFNEETGVGKWACTCGVERTRTASIMCKR